MSIYGNNIVSEGFFKDLKQKSKEKQHKKRLDIAMKLYTEFVNYISKPYIIMAGNAKFGFDDVGEICKLTGVSEDELLKKINASSSLNTTMKKFIGKTNDYYDFISQLSIKLIQLGDTEAIFISDNKIYRYIEKRQNNSDGTYSNYSVINDITGSSLLSGSVSKYSNLFYYYGIDREIMEEADALLGYYRIAKAPEGVTPKKLPI